MSENTRDTGPVIPRGTDEQAPDPADTKRAGQAPAQDDKSGDRRPEPNTSRRKPTS
jgi:hypothetical protein